MSRDIAHFIGIPSNDAIHEITKRIDQKWQNIWNEISLNIKLEEIKRTTKKWHSNVTLTRRQDVFLTRTRIGHSYLTHAHVLNHEPQPICPTCNKPVTTKHIFTECTKYNNERLIFKFPNNIQNIIKENNEESILKYIKLLNLYSLI
ncbi:uncharacterized protein LOC126899329 [Daktulosphaira vitifoliae]|uniref:uncharacterized protein LOC126899329 n=1 Tax=Daktulosphaira vitifoliae TaxID=58002 RepID=UPI0021AA08F0|nr:uncharacterized protein LOC126899329 [Daktulosphaira vitifoliae]